jgi:AraC-like DNA-binding protein
MAARAGVSSRTLTRLFREQLSISPARYVEQDRVEAAQALLLNGSPVARTAQLSGFNSAETLRRVFVSQAGVSPSVYASSAAGDRGQARIFLLHDVPSFSLSACAVSARRLMAASRRSHWAACSAMARAAWSRRSASTW